MTRQAREERESIMGNRRRAGEDMDALDLAILGSLQEDGRRPNADIARQYGVASSTILERVRRLEQRGAIIGYRVLIDGEAIGFEAQALVTVTLASDQIDAVERFEEGVAGIPEVQACYGISGRYDYMPVSYTHLRAHETRHDL